MKKSCDLLSYLLWDWPPKGGTTNLNGEQMKYLLSALLILSTVLAAEEPRWFVDNNLVFEQGSALSEQYLQKHAPEFFQSLEKTIPWVVRLEARHTFINGGYKSNHGTGIILNDGSILTADHVLTESVNGSNIEVVVTHTDGQVNSATVLQQGEKDWARLKLDAELQSPIRMAKPVSGETVVFFGYPAQLGIDDKGEVCSFNKNEPASLLPMLVIAAVEDCETMLLKPLAGFPPVGGMSGGPILNLKGEVVGVQSSVSKTTADATGEALYYKINAVPADSIYPSPEQ
jgi:S1-C subfamily serine protease